MPFSVAGHVGPWSYFGLGLHNPEQLRLMGSSSPFLSDTHRIHGAAIYGNIYHKYTPNVSIYTIHGSYGICSCLVFFSRVSNFASTSYALPPHGNPADVCVCVFQVFFDSRQILPARNQVRTVPGATSDILIRVSIQTLQILRSMQVLASAFQECSKRNNIWSAGLKGT